MRVNPIRSYNGLNSAPQKKQVSFGLIENEENTKRVLPKNSDYRIPFDTQWEYLKKHDAVTVTSEGGEVWAKIKPELKEWYKVLIECETIYGINYLKGLQKQDQFDAFYHALESCDYNRQGPKPPVTNSVPEDPYWDRLTEALFRTGG